MPDTCGGYCCEKFRLGAGRSLSPDDLKEERKKGGENEMIADMVIYLGYGTKDIDGDEGKAAHWYTCKHFDKDTRLCKIYDQRPNMCREYNTHWWAPCGVRQCKMKPPEKPEHKLDEPYQKKEVEDVPLAR